MQTACTIKGKKNDYSKLCCLKQMQLNLKKGAHPCLQTNLLWFLTDDCVLWRDFMFYEVCLDEEHLNQYKTFECCSNSKVDANFFFLKMALVKAIHPLATTMWPQHTRKKSYTWLSAEQHLTIREVAEDIKISLNPCQKILTEDSQLWLLVKLVPHLLTV